MAQLPDYTALGERPTPVLPRRTPLVADFRGTSGMEEAPAQQMAHSAAEFDSAARLALHAQEQHDALRADDAVTKLRQKQIDMTFGKNGFATLKGADAVNRPLLKDYGSQFDNAAAELGASLDNNFQRQIFTRRAQNAGLQLREDIVRHVAHENDVYANNVFTARVDTEIQAAGARWAMPDAATVPLLNIKNAIDNYAERFGKPKEWQEDTFMKAQSKVFDAIIRQAVVPDPKVARELFKSYSTKLTALDAAQLDNSIAVHEQQAKARLQPIEARRDAESAMEAAPAPVRLTPTSAPTGRLDDAGRLAILREQLSDPDRDRSPGPDAELRREIAKLEARVGSVAPTATTPSGRLTATDIRSNLAQWIVNAEARAEKTHPGDPVYRDMVVNQVKSKVSTIVLAKEGEQRAANKALVGFLAGLDGNPKPISTEQLFARPGATEAFTQLEPDQQAGVLRHLELNRAEAEGKPAQASAKLEQALLARMHLPSDDPLFLSKPEQLTPYIGPGRLDIHGLNNLRGELERIRTGGAGFQHDVQSAFSQARVFAMRSIVGSIQPDLAEEAVLNWRTALNAKVDEIRKAGGEPRDAFTPGKPDNMLTREKVQSFMPNASKVVQEAADRAKTAVALDPKNLDASFDALPPGTTYSVKMPDGTVRVGLKPGTAPAPTVPGLLQPGNINLNTRPVVRNADGSISTVRSMSFEDGGKQVLIPTVVGNRVVSDDEAIRHYRQTGEFLGKFDTPEHATAYAVQLHESQAKQYAQAPPIYESFISPLPRGGFKINAPARSPARALDGKTFSLREDALKALAEKYGETR